MPAAPGRKLKHGAGVTRALPRPNATAPGCGESGPQELDHAGEKPCRWRRPRHQHPPGGGEQKHQPPAGTGTTHAAVFFVFFSVFFFESKLEPKQTCRLFWFS